MTGTKNFVSEVAKTQQQKQQQQQQQEKQKQQQEQHYFTSYTNTSLALYHSIAFPHEMLVASCTQGLIALLLGCCQEVPF